MSVPPPRVLVVDDAGGWVQGILTVLRRRRVAVLVVPEGPDTVDIAHRFQPWVIILGASARECVVRRKLRRICDAHVIEVDADAPADTAPTVPRADIVTLPRLPEGLSVPMQAIPGADRPPGAGRRLVVGPLSIDIALRQVSVADVDIHLTRVQFDILAALARRAGSLVSRTELATAVWGPHRTGSPGLLDVHIGHLRKRLGDDPTKPMLVVTVRGRGFRLATNGWSRTWS